MKIIVLSDTHGDYRVLQKIAFLHQEADMFIHLGDGERELYQLFTSQPWAEQKFHCLKGNCDYNQDVKIYRTLTLDLPYGHRIFAAHGDYFQVKFGTARIVHEARENQADIVLYGHTHISDCRYEDGLYILNPGSLSLPRDGKRPSYALIDVSEKGILPNLVFL
ncbi:MAG: metallophosphoesterase [Oscillospiraceae bacterium]|nr:metallophosphoesterase [Oscillospiraceae bacterium]